MLSYGPLSNQIQPAWFHIVVVVLDYSCYVVLGLNWHGGRNVYSDPRIDL